MTKTVVVLRREILPFSETFVVEQMRHLQHWQAILVGTQRLENGLGCDDVTTHIIPEHSHLLEKKYLQRLRNYFWLKNPKVSEFLSRLSPDLIHIHFGVDAVYFWQSITDLNIPILITLHGYDINIYKSWWQAGYGGRVMQKYPDRLLAIAQHPNVRFIAVSQAIKQRAIDYGIPEDKITVHYIGVDTDKFKPKGLPISMRENIIVFVGRFVEKKAPLALIEAFSKVIEQVPDAKLVMVGDGELRAQAEQLARHLGLPVVFRGVLSAEEIQAELDKAKVFCLPSVTAKNGDAEGLPISILEAISKNIFVVVTKHSGNPDITDIEKFGCLVHEDSNSELIEALVKMLKQKDKIDISQTLSFFERFDIKNTQKRIETIYQELSNG
ncbi:MAG: glycosyltransferase [Moraxella sp.]|nr:glycosyltransferase [Moraxella sp.]